VNLEDRNGIAFYSFNFYLTPYTLQVTAVLSHYQSVAFVYSSADHENLTVLRRPRSLTLIDLLYSHRTSPQKHDIVTPLLKKTVWTRLTWATI